MRATGPGDVQVFLVLDTFDHHLRSACSRQTDQRTQMYSCAPIRAGLMQISTIDFCNVHTQFHKTPHGTVACTDVIESDATSELLQRPDEVHDCVDVGQRRAFRQLDDEPCRDLRFPGKVSMTVDRQPPSAAL